MVGEIVGGAVTGIVQGMSVAAMEAPVVAVQSAAVGVAEAVAPLTQTVTQSLAESSSAVAGSMGSAAGNMGTQMVQVASSGADVSKAVGGIQEEVSTKLVAESMAESLTGTTSKDAEILGGKIEGLLTDGADTESVMCSLSEGLLTGQEDVPTATLVEEAQNMTNFSNEQLSEVFAAVDTVDVPKDMLDDPTFREDIAQHLFEQATAQKEDMTKKEDLMAMMQKSAEAAKEKHARRQEVESSKSEKKDKEELENLKKKAAMEAVRKQMDTWRQSVMVDKRLTQEARGIALKKIDKVESRLLLQTQMKWDGKSLLKMIAVAALWLTE